MYNIDFKKPIPIHFIGIGGISMSSLAEILIHAGFQITGSDSIESKLTSNLEQLGARIFIGQHSDHISSNTAVVIYTAAVHEDNEIGRAHV